MYRCTIWRVLHAPAYLGLIVWAWRQQIVRRRMYCRGGGDFAWIGAVHCANRRRNCERPADSLGAEGSVPGRYYGWAVLATQFDVVVR